MKNNKWINETDFITSLTLPLDQHLMQHNFVCSSLVEQEVAELTYFINKTNNFSSSIKNPWKYESYCLDDYFKNTTYTLKMLKIGIASCLTGQLWHTHTHTKTWGVTKDIIQYINMQNLSDNQHLNQMNDPKIFFSLCKPTIDGNMTKMQKKETAETRKGNSDILKLCTFAKWGSCIA